MINNKRSAIKKNHSFDELDVVQKLLDANDRES